MDKSVLPTSKLYVPVSHERHVTESTWDLNVPAGQIAGLYVP